MPAYYGRHGLNEQRAYQIVCLMVGSDPVRFKALADETKLPATGGAVAAGISTRPRGPGRNC